MSTLANPLSVTLEVWRAEVREVGAVMRDATIIDRRARRRFLPGSWKVTSCERNLRFKHWKLKLEPID